MYSISILQTSTRANPCLNSDHVQPRPSRAAGDDGLRGGAAAEHRGAADSALPGEPHEDGRDDAGPDGPGRLASRGMVGWPPNGLYGKV